MPPQSLKASILQLAIQGRLVEQRPEETIVEKSAFSLDQAPFDIPDSWKWGKLGKCCEMYTGNSISESEKRTKYEGQTEGLDYIGTKDVSFDQTICYDNGVKIPPEHAVGFKKAQKDAVLMCIEGGSAGRKIAILDREVCFGNKLCMFWPKTILNTYLFFYLQSLEFKKAFAGNLSGIIGGVSIKKLKEIVFPIPPLAEQKRIVAKIEELLPLVDRYERAWSKLEDFNKRFPGDMQKSLLQMAIQGKLVEQRPEEGTGEELYRQIQAEKQRLVKAGKLKKEKPLPEIAADEIPFEIPESWKWVRIANVWSVLNGDRGKNYPAKSTLSKTGIPFISALNLDGRTVVNDDRLLCLSEKQYDLLGNGKLNKGDIVVCIRGSLGKHGRYPFERGAIASSLVILRSQLQLPVLDDFLLLYLDAPLFFCEIKRFDNGTAQPNLAAKSLEQFLFPLPPLAEQKRIVAKLEELLPLCEKLK